MPDEMQFASAATTERDMDRAAAVLREPHSFCFPLTFRTIGYRILSAVWGGGEMAAAADLKSVGVNPPCGFDSLPPHHAMALTQIRRHEQCSLFISKVMNASLNQPEEHFA
jgi:hypothetical protein